MMMLCPRCWGKIKPCDKCRSSGKLDDVKLSVNFMLSEMLYSPTAVEKSISNDPTALELKQLIESTVNLFQPARDLWGPTKVTSAFRSPALNTAIKGAKDSAHMKAMGMDSQPQLISLQEAMVRLWKSTLKFDQAILEMGKHHNRTNDDWLHLGYKHPATRLQRRQFLIMENGVYRPWKPPT